MGIKHVAGYYAIQKNNDMIPTVKSSEFNVMLILYLQI